MTPKRIQHMRTKGWRMPEGAVYVGRPGKWGNPFKVGGLIILTGKKAGQHADAADCVEFFRNTLNMKQNAADRAMIRAELAGKDLACWCPVGQPCHADVLLEIAAGRGDS